ncbi:hypothetical protein B9W62_04170 [Streptomyces sp. CS113]|nr:hypothetical protein B9W62_04170 [Streptomyces sp. CS113]
MAQTAETALNVVLTVDDAPGVSRAVALGLRRRYGASFRMVRAESAETGLSALRELKLRRSSPRYGPAWPTGRALRDERRTLPRPARRTPAPRWSPPGSRPAAAPIRYALWSAHDVVRHVRDVVILAWSCWAALALCSASRDPSIPRLPRPAMASHLGRAEPEEILRELTVLVDQEEPLPLERRAGIDPPDAVAGQARVELSPARRGRPACPADELRTY